MRPKGVMDHPSDHVTLRCETWPDKPSSWCRGVFFDLANLSPGRLLITGFTAGIFGGSSSLAQARLYQRSSSGPAAGHERQASKWEEIWFGDLGRVTEFCLKRPVELAPSSVCGMLLYSSAGRISCSSTGARDLQLALRPGQGVDAGGGPFSGGSGRSTFTHAGAVSYRAVSAFAGPAASLHPGGSTAHQQAPSLERLAEEPEVEGSEAQENVAKVAQLVPERVCAGADRECLELAHAKAKVSSPLGAADGGVFSFGLGMGFQRNTPVPWMEKAVRIKSQGEDADQRAADAAKARAQRLADEYEKLRQSSRRDDDVERVSSILGDVQSLKQHVRRFWESRSQVSSEIGLDLQGFQALVNNFDIYFSVPATSFGKVQETFHCFDFNGNGLLDLRESYRCVMRCLANFLKQRGGARPPELPFKSPAQAGYTLLRVLASGGQGEASLVRTQSGEEVILKSYGREIANARGLTELVEEAEHMREVNTCEHVAHCLEIFQDFTNLYLISAANLGGDLAHVRSRAELQGALLSSSWFRTVFGQAFSGVKHLHDNAILHCDLKEPNLMLKHHDLSKPCVVIIDLGLSQTFLAKSSGPCGTPGYIPPETWQYGRWYPQGDIFSLGVMCAQLMAEKVPDEKTGATGIFTENCQSIEEITEATLRYHPPLLQLLRAVNADLATLRWLELCLSKSPDQRPRAPQVLEMQWFQEEESCEISSAATAKRERRPTGSTPTPADPTPPEPQPNRPPSSSPRRAAPGVDAARRAASSGFSEPTTTKRPTLRQEHLEQQANVRIAELERRCTALTSENSDLKDKLALRPPSADSLSLVLPLRAKVGQLEAGLDSAKRWNMQLVSQRDALLAEVEQLRGCRSAASWLPAPGIFRQPASWGHPVSVGSPRRETGGGAPGQCAVGPPEAGDDDAAGEVLAPGRISPSPPPFAPGTWARATGGPPPRVAASRLLERERRGEPTEPTSPSGSNSSGDSRSAQSMRSEVWEADGTTSFVLASSSVPPNT